MTTGVVVRGNLATGSDRDGLLIFGNRNIVRDNQAIGNTQTGFFVTGSEHEVLDNQAVSNGGPGYWINGSTHIVRRNLAVDNGSEGVLVRGEGHTFSRNVLVGNRGSGIVAGSAGLVFRRNDIYGNSSVLNPYLANCGLVNNSAGTITATDNFWGAESGPGSDPADEVCETAGGNTIVEPYALHEIRLPVDPPLAPSLATDPLMERE